MHEISKISEVSNIEYVHLVSTFWYRNDKNFNCSLCKKTYSLGVRESRKSCYTVKDKVVVNYNELIKYYRCPSNYYNPAYGQLIDMFRLFQQGILPFTGGIFDQPSKILEVFTIIESLEIEKRVDVERKIKWQKGQSKLNSQLTSKKR